MKLFKTTIVIWTKDNATDVDLTILAQSATDGDAYCSKQECARVEDPESDLDWDGTEFFEQNA